MKKLTTFLFSFLMILTMTFAQKGKEFIYVGTYSVRDSKGIYVFEFDRATGNLKLIQTVSDLKNPAFLDFHPNGKFLYSISEMDHTGGAAAFSIESATGKLKLINQKSSEGQGACHIAIDKTGKMAFVSNYGGGSLAVFPIQIDGSLNAASTVITYTGNSINKDRQEKPHIHSTFISPDNKYILVSDLGTDKIYTYQINPTEGKITEASKPFLSVTPGAGPRHLVFHPNGRYVYSAEELYSTVGVLSYDKLNGSLQIINDTVRSLPVTFKEFNKSADIHTDPKGKFLYLSNRGLQAISIFAIQDNGGIKLITQQDVMGKTPRNFLVDPEGEFVFVANQDSDNLMIFKLDQKTGKMTYTGNEVKVPSPVCVKMLFR